MFLRMKSKILEYLGFLFGYIVDYCVHKLVFLATSIKLRLFADDACLSYQHCNFDQVNVVINKELSRIDDWLRKNRLFINYSNTKF